MECEAQTHFFKWSILPFCYLSGVLLHISAQEYFFLKAQPSVSLHFPPAGWQRMSEQPAQGTTV